MRALKIISGGQTGADRAALDAGRTWSVAIGGWIPKGRTAEDGTVPPHFAELRETETSDPRERTRANVVDSDGTVIVSHGALSGGSALTQEIARELQRPVLHLDMNQYALKGAVDTLVEWLSTHRVRTLNVAGPRASRDPRIYEKVFLLMSVLIARLAGDRAETTVDRGIEGPAFMASEVDWGRVDFTALVCHTGVATVRLEDADICRDWLRARHYEILSLDLSVDLEGVCAQLETVFSWREMFGYAVTGGGSLPGLDALRDGFDFTIAPHKGKVLELRGLEIHWAREAEWTRGLLSIATEHSRYQLALGRRFFTLLPLPADTKLLGAPLESLGIPYFGWTPPYCGPV